MGGLGVTNPTETAILYYSISTKATDVIVQAIVSKSEFAIDAHANHSKIRKEAIETKNQLFVEK